MGRKANDKAKGRSVVEKKRWRGMKYEGPRVRANRGERRQ